MGNLHQASEGPKDFQLVNRDCLNYTESWIEGDVRTVRILQSLPPAYWNHCCLRVRLLSRACQAGCRINAATEQRVCMQPEIKSNPGHTRTHTHTYMHTYIHACITSIPYSIQLLIFQCVYIVKHKIVPSCTEITPVADCRFKSYRSAHTLDLS